MLGGGCLVNERGFVSSVMRKERVSGEREKAKKKKEKAGACPFL
jgi:hypothetical protein